MVILEEVVFVKTSRTLIWYRTCTQMFVKLWPLWLCNRSINFEIKEGGPFPLYHLNSFNLECCWFLGLSGISLKCIKLNAVNKFRWHLVSEWIRNLKVNEYRNPFWYWDFTQSSFFSFFISILWLLSCNVLFQLKSKYRKPYIFNLSNSTH